MTEAFLKSPEAKTREKISPVCASQGVDLTVRARKTYALMGGNGAGKSTLLKVITCVYACDSGETRLDSALVATRSLREAEAVGISIVYQGIT